MGEKPLMHRPQMPGGTADPVGQSRPIEIDALTDVNLRLTIQRQMVGVFADQHVSDGRFRR